MSARTAFVSSEASAGSGADESVELAASEAQAGTSASPCSSVDDAKVRPCSPTSQNIMWILAERAAGASAAVSEAKLAIRTGPSGGQHAW